MNNKSQKEALGEKNLTPLKKIKKMIKCVSKEKEKKERRKQTKKAFPTRHKKEK